MAYDEGLAQRLHEILDEHPGLVTRKMFGGVAFMLEGNMAVGVSGDELMVRVGPEGFEAALDALHTRPFDLTGRRMKGWILVAPAGIESDEDLRGWVSRGTEIALSLPPK